MFIRVEHTDGLGPFTPHCGEVWRPHSTVAVDLQHLLDTHTLFPTPEEEGLHITEAYYCAYTNIREWLTVEDIHILAQYGYAFYLVEATDIQRGEAQILFHEDTVVEKIDITEFLLKNKDFIKA